MIIPLISVLNDIDGSAKQAVKLGISKNAYKRSVTDVYENNSGLLQVADELFDKYSGLTPN